MTTRAHLPLNKIHDWNAALLALIGATSFLISGYWIMAVSPALSELIQLTNQQGLTWTRTLGFAFMGGIGVVIWFFGCLAARCHTELYRRLFP